ncbi:hypothetical protein D3C73_1152940 [compost metagenome]
MSNCPNRIGRKIRQRWLTVNDTQHLIEHISSNPRQNKGYQRAEEDRHGNEHRLRLNQPFSADRVPEGKGYRLILILFYEYMIDQRGPEQ